MQVPWLIVQARKSGIVRYVGRGANYLVQRSDVVDLYIAALERAPAGSFYFVENGEASFAQIAQAIATAIGTWRATVLVSRRSDRGVGGYIHAAHTFGSNSPVRAKRARTELGWQSRHTSLIQWIEREGWGCCGRECTLFRLNRSK